MTPVCDTCGLTRDSGAPCLRCAKVTSILRELSGEDGATLRAWIEGVARRAVESHENDKHPTW